MGKPKLSTSAAEGWAKAKAGNVGRRHEHEPRHRDAFLGAEEGAALLLGVWVSCRSSWVLAAMYDAEQERLWVRFGKGGQAEAEGHYAGVSFAEAESFASAPSKGGWLHDNGFIKGRAFVNS